MHCAQQVDRSGPGRSGHSQVHVNGRGVISALTLLGPATVDAWHCMALFAKRPGGLERAELMARWIDDLAKRGRCCVGPKELRLCWLIVRMVQYPLCQVACVLGALRVC